MAGSEVRLSRATVYIRSRMGEDSLSSLFAEIWHYYYPRLKIFIRNMSIPPEDIDDAIQESMLKVYRNLGSYRPDSALSTWIYRITRNHCLDRIRKEQIRARSAVGFGNEELISPYPTPETVVLRSEEVRMAGELVRSLSPEDRQLAFLRFFEELPFKQIAEITGRPVGTLKYRIHQIRKKLREKRSGNDAF